MTINLYFLVGMLIKLAKNMREIGHKAEGKRQALSTSDDGDDDKWLGFGDWEPAAQF